MAHLINSSSSSKELNRQISTTHVCTVKMKLEPGNSQPPNKIHLVGSFVIFGQSQAVSSYFQSLLPKEITPTYILNKWMSHFTCWSAVGGARIDGKQAELWLLRTRVGYPSCRHWFKTEPPQQCPLCSFNDVVLQISQRQHHQLHHQLERRHGLQRSHTQTPVRGDEWPNPLSPLLKCKHTCLLSVSSPHCPSSLLLSNCPFSSCACFIFLFQARSGGLQQSEEVQPDPQPPGRLQRGRAEAWRDQTVRPWRQVTDIGCAFM